MKLRFPLSVSSISTRLDVIIRCIKEVITVIRRFSHKLDSKLYEPKFVIVCPFTKFTDKQEKLLSKIIRLASRDSVSRILLIDKTIDSKVEKAYRNLVAYENVTCVVRSREESLFASLSCVNLNEGEWIGQIHDDDDFQGSLGFSRLTGAKEILRPTIKISSNEHPRLSTSLELVTSPAFILFSFLPSPIWNQFAGYIRAQGKNCSPALDVALSFITSLICEFKELETYTYIYNSDNWLGRFNRIMSIRRYMQFDNWGSFSGQVMAEFSNQMDKLGLAVWLEREQFASRGLRLAPIALDSLSPSKWHLYRIKVAALVMNTIAKSSRFFRPFCFRNLPDFIGFVARRQSIYSTVVGIYQSRDLYEIAGYLERLLVIDEIQPLHTRISFWIENLKSVPNQSKK